MREYDTRLFSFFPVQEGDFVLEAGKRLAIRIEPGYGEWSRDGYYTSLNQRSQSDSAQGGWDEWVELAKAILEHDEKMQAKERYERRYEKMKKRMSQKGLMKKKEREEIAEADE